MTAIHEAAARGDVASIARMLAEGVAIDSTNEYSHTPLMDAASQGHTYAVRLLLDAGANPRLLNSLALDFAVRLGDSDSVRLLLDAGADPNRNEPDDNDHCDPPPIVDAVQRRNLDMVQLLIGAGARIDVECEGYGLLALAVQLNDKTLFEFLLDHKASAAGGLRAVASCGHLDFLDQLLRLDTEIDSGGSDGMTPLALAAYYGRRALVKQLLDLGAKLECRDVCGRTPLGQAVQESKLATARILLEAGAHLDGDTNETLLCTAIWNRRPQLVDLLLQSGADPNETRASKPPPLFLAVDSRKQRIVELLLSSGADPNVRLSKERQDGFTSKLVPGTTPLMFAARKGLVSIAHQLLAAGASPRLLDDKGRSAADLAARAGWPELAQTLIDAGAPIAINPQQRSSAALLRAVRKSDTAAALAALAAGADPNATDRTDKSALAWAAQNGLAEVVRALLGAGALPNTISKYGHTALRIAVLRPSAPIIRMLVEGGADVNYRFSPASMPAETKNTVYASHDTVLHDASVYNTAEIQLLLIEAGADVNCVGEGDLTPLLAAVNFRRMDSVELLLTAGALVRPQDEMWLAPYRFAKAADNAIYRSCVEQIASISGAPPENVDRLPGVYCYRMKVTPMPQQPIPSDPVEAGRKWGETFNREWTELDQKVETVLREASLQVQQRGFMLLDAGKPVGCGPMVQFIVLLPTSDKYQAMVAFGVRANDQELHTADIIRRFRELETVEPFELRGVSFDTVDVEFHHLVKNPDALALQLSAFCHDLFEGDASKLAAWLRSNRRIKFWWD